MTPSTPKDPKSKVARYRKAWALPGTFLALIVLVLGFLGVRGTWADTEPRNPTSASEGVVSQLYQPPGSAKQMRCALVIDAPIDRVWSVITDYSHFDEIFPYISETRAEETSPGLYAVSMNVNTALGSWHVETPVRHEESAEGFVASWDGTAGELLRNRGSWSITRLDAGRTRVVYTLEIAVKPFPNFLVRGVVLGQLDRVVLAVRDRLAKSP